MFPNRVSSNWLSKSSKLNTIKLSCSSKTRSAIVMTAKMKSMTKAVPLLDSWTLRTNWCRRSWQESFTGSLLFGKTLTSLEQARIRKPISWLGVSATISLDYSLTKSVAEILQVHNKISDYMTQKKYLPTRMFYEEIISNDDKGFFTTRG